MPDFRSFGMLDGKISGSIIELDDRMATILFMTIKYFTLFFEDSPNKIKFIITKRLLSTI